MLAVNLVNVRLYDLLLAHPDVIQLVDGSNNKAVGIVVTFELSHENRRIVSVLNSLTLTGKATVLVEALRAKLYTVHDEDNLYIGEVRLYQLGSLERRHSLSRAGGVPDISATLSEDIPLRIPHLVADGTHGIVLIRAQHLQRPVFIVGNGI